MLSNYFIDRPLFATVVSAFIVIAGLAAFRELPVAMYPDITPPQIVVATSYPGASADVIAETVATPLEQALNGVENMLYMRSNSSSSGLLELSITFAVGTDPDISVINVQNRVQSALQLLPEEVRRQGVTVAKALPSFLQIITFDSPDGRYDPLFVSNYATLNVIDELRRIPGVGNVQVFGARDYSIRIWLQPDRLAELGLTPGDIVAAVREQNVQSAAGRLGDEPIDERVDLTLSVTTQARLSDPEEFERIVIRTGEGGEIVRLKDVARVELGARDYSFGLSRQGRPVIGAALQLAPNANALQSAAAVYAKMEELGRSFPAGLEYAIPYDTSKYVRVSMREVAKTFVEALVLVFLVVWLFLYNLRATVIPSLAVPVSLIGTFAGMYMLGFSINSLTLFGMVLAIGIVVDDAIVVVENAERHLRAGMAPVEAAHVTMDEVGGALIGIALVLVAVFVPTAFMGGITGEFYKQFALTIASATAISLLVSLTLSPALAAVILKPHDATAPRTTTGARLHALGERANGWLESMSAGYGRLTGVLLRRSVLVFVLYAGLLVLTGWRVLDTPRGFIPAQDQNNVAITITMPPGTSLARTDAVVQQAIPIILATPGVSSASVYAGMDGITFSPATNSGQIWAIFEPFEERLPRGLTASAIAQDLRKRLSHITAAELRIINPASVRGLGNSGGFRMMIEDRSGLGYRALEDAVQRLADAASADPAISLAFSNFNTRNPTLDAVVDRDKAEMLGVPVRNVFATLQTYLAGVYVNNINLLGHTFQVIAQGDASYRQDEAWVGNLQTRSVSGAMVPLNAVAQLKPATAPYRVLRYNLYPAADIQGDTAPGHSSGEAMAAMERLAREILPSGMAFEWTDIAYQQQLSGNAGGLAFVLGVVFVFIFLAALYESLTLPLAVILIVPMCLLAAMLGVNFRGLDNNILTQIGMVVLIGLAAKNAILIVEFARQGEENGLSPIDAAIAAARTRLRPILMTSAAFIFGVIPLAFGSGPGAELRQALGVAVFFGMIGVTVFGLVFTPAFYVLCRRLAGQFARVPRVRVAEVG